ncbi:MAG TPA: hypothetical protein VG186_16915 [Solirubrobacteraceae bacterium]|nr:hypothetical protein [Solirubrobacteraceae bacterium]
MPVIGGPPRACTRLTAVAMAIATVCLIGAGRAQAAVTASNITAPGDGTALIDNEATNPGATVTVSGTTNGTTGDSVDVDCYHGGSVVRDPTGSVVGYTGPTSTGIAVDNAGGFTASVPLQAFAGYSCELIAVPHGTTPSPTVGFTGPRVATSHFYLNTVTSGPNSGAVYDFGFGDETLLGNSLIDSTGDCGPGQSLYDGSPVMNASPYLLKCAGNLYGSSSDFASATAPDLTRSEIQVDGQNAYNPDSAEKLFSGADQLPGFPAATVTVGFDASTGTAGTTSTEPLAKCTPADVHDPTAGDCTSFVSTGVTLERVTGFSGDGRIETVSDTYSSTDGAAHSLDLEYETDLANTAAGWELPGQTTFTAHATGDRAGAPPSAVGTIYAIYNSGAAPSLANPVAALTFATPYSSITFDNTLWSGYTVLSAPAPLVSGLIGYQRTVPAGGSVTIQWSAVTGASLGEVQGEAEAAQDAYAPPTIAISSPTPGTTVSTNPVLVTGTVSAGSGVKTLTVNGVPAMVSGGTFAAAVPLAVGLNTITAAMTTNAGGANAAAEAVSYNGAAPVASTGSASQVGSSTAKLSGKVTAGSSAASYYFRYGKSTAYGHRTRARSLAAGTAPVPVSAELPPLSAHTTYHYRLVATSKAAASYGKDAKFQTRFALRHLAVSVSPHRATSAPYHFTVSGSLTLPKGVTRGQGCKGTVTVVTKHGAKQVTAHAAKVSRRCTYSATASLSAHRLKGHGTLSFTVTFNGNAKLGADTAKPAKAVFG